MRLIGCYIDALSNARLRSMTPFRRSLSLSVVLALGACTPGPVVSGTDAGPADTGVPPDAGPLMVSWSTGPAYPHPVAFGTAIVLPGGDGFAYLYVVGGTDGTFGSLSTIHADIQRAQIQADGSLGAWQLAGSIGNGSADIPLAGHGMIRVVADDGAIGMAIAGGGGPTGTLGQVLAGYVQNVDQSVGMWGAFTPVISAAQGGQVFGSFNTFEAHQLALVGGLQGSTPVDHVIIAATMDVSVPTWRDGPPLPQPRYAHGSAQVGVSALPDIYLIGGLGTGGSLASTVLVAVRDSTMEVTSWASAGTLPGAVAFPQISVMGDHVYVMGGVAGDPGFDALVTSVRVASATASTVSAHGTLSEFAAVPGGDLPEGRAGALVATFGTTVYIVGGMMGPDHASSASVIYAQLER